MIFLTKIKNNAAKFGEKIGKDDIFTQAAALAYYTALAMAPLIILTITLLSALNLGLQEQLLIETQELIGKEASQVLATIIEGAKNRPDLTSFAGWTAAAVLMLSASVVFGQLQSTLNLIFVAKKTEPVARSFIGSVRHLVFRRLISIGILLTFIFLAIVSLTVSTALTFLLSNYDLPMAEVINLVTNLLIFTGLFSVIYKWMPDRHVKTSSTLVAGLLTSILFVGGKALIGIYLGQTAVGSAYGAAGSLVVFLAWVYYSALIFFLGAEVSAAFVIEEMPQNVDYKQAAA